MPFRVSFRLFSSPRGLTVTHRTIGRLDEEYPPLMPLRSADTIESKCCGLTNRYTDPITLLERINDRNRRLLIFGAWPKPEQIDRSHDLILY